MRSHIIYRTILKLVLPATGLNLLTVPRGSRLLSVQFQCGHITAWIAGDLDGHTTIAALPAHKKQVMKLFVATTGETVQSDWKYIATLPYDNRPLEFHVFHVDHEQ